MDEESPKSTSLRPFGEFKAKPMMLSSSESWNHVLQVRGQASMNLAIALLDTLRRKHNSRRTAPAAVSRHAPPDARWEIAETEGVPNTAAVNEIEVEDDEEVILTEAETLLRR